MEYSHFLYYCQHWPTPHKRRRRPLAAHALPSRAPVSFDVIESSFNRAVFQACKLISFRISHTGLGRAYVVGKTPRSFPKQWEWPQWNAPTKDISPSAIIEMESLPKTPLVWRSGLSSSNWKLDDGQSPDYAKRSSMTIEASDTK